jgi:hypothetical protein
MTPWLWGINGATSVTASVLAVMISSAWGISAAWWSGVASYVLAAFAIVWSARQLERTPSGSGRTSTNTGS